jgi:hypothetical protein
VTEMGAGERFEPVPDLRFKFHRTPRHTSDAITSLRGIGHPHTVELHGCHIAEIREAPPKRAGTSGREQRDPSIVTRPVDKPLREGLLNRGEMRQGPPVGKPCATWKVAGRKRQGATIKFRAHRDPLTMPHICTPLCTPLVNIRGLLAQRGQQARGLKRREPLDQLRLGAVVVMG